MISVLFISAHAPTNLYPQAGQKIALRYLEEYSQTATVDVLVICNQAEINAANDLKEKFCDRLYTYPISRIQKISSCLINFNIPLKFATRINKQALIKLENLLKEKTYDIIHFEYSHAAVYWNLIDKYIDLSKTKIVISIHDVLSQSFLRKCENNPILGIEVARLFSYEKKLYNAARELWVLSAKDRDILTSLFGIQQQNTIVKPPQLSKFVFNVQRSPQTIVPKTLLFWAAMNRPENEEGILAFIEQCFNKLLQLDPEYKLYIVGYNPSKRIQSKANKNIIVTGFVEDPTPFFEQASIGIVPLLKGAGVKLKTLEMLETGLPAIATSVGAEGVDSTDKKLIINDNLSEWVNLIYYW